MRRTLKQFRVFLETQPVHGGRDGAALAPGARRDLPLPAVAADPRAVGARQVPAAGGGAGVPDRAVAGAGHGDRVLLLRAFGSLDAESRLSQFVSEHIFPQMPDVTDQIREFSGKVSIGALGGGGLLFTLVTCYSLYSYVEKIFNDIWRVGERRTLIGKFLTFYAMVTLLPSAAAFSLYWSGRLVESGSVSRFIMSALIQLLALTFMNKLLPRTNVELGRGDRGRASSRRSCWRW